MGRRDKERVKRIKAGTEIAISVKMMGQPSKPTPGKFTPVTSSLTNRKQRREKIKI